MSEERSTSKAEWLLAIILVGAIVSQNILSMRILHEIRTLKVSPQVTLGTPEKPRGIPAGIRAPSIRRNNSHGVPVALEEHHGDPVLLVFSSPTCKYCTDLYPSLKQLSEVEGRQLKIILVQLNSSPEENLKLQEEQGLTFDVLAAEREDFLNYEVPGTPFSVLVDARGLVSKSATLNTFEQLSSFIQSEVS